MSKATPMAKLKNGVSTTYLGPLTVKYTGPMEVKKEMAQVWVYRDRPLRCKAKIDGVIFPDLPVQHFNIRPSQLQELWEVQGRN